MIRTKSASPILSEKWTLLIFRKYRNDISYIIKKLLIEVSSFLLRLYIFPAFFPFSLLNHSALRGEPSQIQHLVQ